MELIFLAKRETFCDDHVDLSGAAVLDQLQKRRSVKCINLIFVRFAPRR